MSEPVGRWDAAASMYLTSSWHSNEAALAHLVSVAKPSGGRYLDIATGAGHAAFAIAPHANEVVATDTSQGMLDVAAAEAQKRGLSNMRFEYADAHDLPFEDGSFDGVVCRCACHHFRDVDKFLAEAHRVLKPAGTLTLIDTVGSEDAGADASIDKLERMRDPSHHRDYSPTEWRRMVRDAGFAIEYEEEIAKPLNAKQWMERQSVPADSRDEIIALIRGSKGWLREYLRPHGEGDSLTFHLAEMTFLLRK